MAAKFVFKKNEPARTVAWPVTIAVPQPAGAVEQQTITARYKMVDPEVMADALTPMKMMGKSADLLQLDLCLAGFDDFKDENGNAVSDEEARAVLLKLPYVVRGLARGYFEMIEGRLPKN